MINTMSQFPFSFIDSIKIPSYTYIYLCIYSKKQKKSAMQNLCAFDVTNQYIYLDRCLLSIELIDQ